MLSRTLSFKPGYKMHRRMAFLLEKEASRVIKLPKSLATIDQLVHVLTCIVFTCSCQQAAVNFGLMDVAGFIPNTPHLMRRPPPTKKNEASLESVMKTLPNKSQAAHQIAFLYVTTKFAEDEVSH